MITDLNQNSRTPVDGDVGHIGLLSNNATRAAHMPPNLIM